MAPDHPYYLQALKLSGGVKFFCKKTWVDRSCSRNTGSDRTAVVALPGEGIGTYRQDV
ncbi:conserved hypothetical protein [Ricinus communis]|uniref:Uncharacterized protein n=1 Tax=Ricinus communis TaxID=3988 RepID=B9RL48_RICCO|nr:conserved hypothetical protein [Ricinus communis]